MKTLNNFLLVTGIATSLLAEQTSNWAKENCETYTKNYANQEDLIINYLDKNNDPDYYLLEKSHDSLIAKIKSFVGMTQSEINSRKASTEKYTRGLNLNHKSSVKSYIERCQKDSAYVKSILDKADSLKFFLEVHTQKIENALMIDFKKSRNDYYQEIAELKAAKNSLSKQDMQKKKLSLEKMDNKLEKDKTLLLSLKDQSENYLSELKNYIIKVPKCILKIYTSELIKSRKLLTSFEEKEKQKK